MAARKPKAAPKVDLHAMGARVLSVYGPFNCRVLIEMSADRAADLFPDGALGAAGHSAVADAALRDVELIRKRAPELADSALAASAVAMALEIEHPYNSATSKSMCQARMAETMRELRGLLPPDEKKDGLDDLAAKRSERRANLASGG